MVIQRHDAHTEKKDSGRRIKTQRKVTKIPAIETMTITPKITIDKLELQVKPKANGQVALSITKFSSKIHEPILYNKAVSNLIHGHR